MSELWEVKRIVAQGLHTDMKRFAFEQNPALRENQDCGVEVAKGFYHFDPVPSDLTSKIGREMCKSTFLFSAYTTPRVRKKRSFAYSAAATIERSLSVLPESQLLLIDKDIRDTYENFEEIDEGALSETISIEFSTSDHQLREIDATQKYQISYFGKEIFEHSSEDVLCRNAVTIATIDPDESDEYIDKLVIPEPIDHERLEIGESVLANAEFWSIIEPIEYPLMQGVSYESAALQIRKIMHTLRTGNM